MSDWIGKVMDVVKEVGDSDISGIRKWTDEQVIAYFNWEEGEDRDVFVWSDVCREARRRGLGVVPDDSKFDFY